MTTIPADRLAWLGHPKARPLSRAQVDASGCWIWTGRVDRKGYGRYGKRGLAAHRVIYELLVRTLSPEETLHHTCRVPGCVNPEHMQPMSRADNARLGHRFHIAPDLVERMLAVTPETA